MEPVEEKTVENGTKSENPFRKIHEDFLIDIKEAFGDKLKEKKLLRKVAKLEKFGSKLSLKGDKLFEKIVKESIKAEKEFLTKANEVVTKEEEFDENVVKLCAAIAQKTNILRKTKEEKFAMDNEIRDCGTETGMLNEALELLNKNVPNISQIKETLDKITADYVAIKQQLAN